VRNTDTALQPVKLVTFDLDGTLVDTASEIAEAVHLTFDALGIPRRPQAEIVNLIGRGTRELMLKLFARMQQEGAAGDGSGPGIDTLLEAFEHHYTDTAGRFAQLYPGCEDTLQRLLDHGVKLVCVTNKEHRHAVRVLEATGIAGYFQLIVGGDTLPVKKPDAGVFAHVLGEVGETAAHTAHVGDSAIDVQAARNAGVRAWAVPWGYNAGVPVAESAPDRMFDRLSHIADCVCV
jgi:phosphoglycolate phosphatase